MPIVAMTAHAMPGDREACLEVGMDGYVTKPIRTATLMDAIRGVLKPEGQPISEETPRDCVDWERALAVVAGDRDLLREVVETYLEECPRMVEQMKLSLRERDSEGLQRAAHTLKGSMRYFGIDGLFECAQQLEDHRQDAVQCARRFALGIGQGETAIDQLRDHADYMEHIKVLIAFGNRFHAAIDRAKPHPAKVWKAYRKWMSAPDCPDDFIPCHGSYLTSGVDRSLEPTAYAELKREDRLWQEAHEWDGRITHTVIDQFDDKGHELAELAAAVPNSVK